MSARAHLAAQVRRLLAGPQEVYDLRCQLDDTRRALARARAELDRANACLALETTRNRQNDRTPALEGGTP